MASLDNLPTIDPPLAGRAPERPLVDFGPEWIDAETVTALGEQIAAGIISLPNRIGETVAAADDDALAAIFAKHLRSSPLTSGYVLQHRVFALSMAFRTLDDLAGEGLASSGEPLTVDPDRVRIAITELEARLLASAERVKTIIPDTDDANAMYVARATSSLDADTLALQLSTSLSTLAAWRSNGMGPEYVKLSNTRRSIRYPVATTIEWLYREVGA